MQPQAVELTQKFFADLFAIIGNLAHIEISDLGEEIYVNLTQSRLPADEAFRTAMERIVRLHLRVQLQKAVPVVVDQEGRVAAHRQKIVERARALAQRAREERRKVELEPMPPQDRRTVHLALANFPGVRTYSVGRKGKRRVVIAPVE